MSKRNGSQAIRQEYVGLSVASRYSGLSRQTFRNLIERGELRAYRPTPGKLVVKLADKPTGKRIPGGNRKECVSRLGGARS